MKRLILETISLLVLAIGCSQGTTPPIDNNESTLMVEAGQTTVPLDDLRFRTEVSESNCQEDCTQIIGLCEAFGVYPDSVAIVEQVTQTELEAFDCTSPRHVPGYVVKIRVLGVVGGQSMPEELEVRGYGSWSRVAAASPGRTMLVPLNQVGDTWFISGGELDVSLGADSFEASTWASNGVDIQLPGTFEQLVSEGAQVFDDIDFCAGKQNGFRSKEEWESFITTPLDELKCDAEYYQRFGPRAGRPIE